MPNRWLNQPSAWIRRVSVRATKRTERRTPPPIIPAPGLNRPETVITRVLEKLKIRFQAQATFLGGDILGGGRMDWLLPDYRVDLEYNGPFHGTTYGTGRDALRNQGVVSKGYRVVTLNQNDLSHLEQVILQKIGRPIG